MGLLTCFRGGPSISSNPFKVGSAEKAKFVGLQSSDGENLDVLMSDGRVAGSLKVSAAKSAVAASYSLAFRIVSCDAFNSLSSKRRESCSNSLIRLWRAGNTVCDCCFSGPHTTSCSDSSSRSPMERSSGANASPFCYLDPMAVGPKFLSTLNLRGCSPSDAAQKVLDSLKFEGDSLLDTAASTIAHCSSSQIWRPDNACHLKGWIVRIRLSYLHCGEYQNGFMAPLEPGIVFELIDAHTSTQQAALASPPKAIKPLPMCLPSSATSSKKILDVVPAIDSSTMSNAPRISWANSAGDVQVLERGYVVAVTLSGIASLVDDSDTSVLFQSDESLEFWGDLSNKRTPPGEGLLSKLFAMQPSLLEEMMECLANGEEWKRTFQVQPPSMDLECGQVAPNFERPTSATLSSRMSPRVASPLRPSSPLGPCSRRESRRQTSKFVSFKHTEMVSTGHVDSESPERGSLVESAAAAALAAQCAGSEKMVSMSEWILPGSSVDEPNHGLSIEYSEGKPLNLCDSANPSRFACKPSLASGLGEEEMRLSAVSWCSREPSSKASLCRGSSRSELCTTPKSPGRGLGLANELGTDMQVSSRAASLLARTSSKRLRRASVASGVQVSDASVATSLQPAFSSTSQRARQSWSTPGNENNLTEVSQAVESEPLSKIASMDVSAVPGARWHQVHARYILDPVSKERVIMIHQNDITDQKELQGCMLELTETQLDMLENMYPRHVLEHITDYEIVAEAADAIAKSHSDVTILFMDIVGFTNMSKEVPPKEVMHYLNELFTMLDDLCSEHKVYKVETAGDCYIVAGGLMKMGDDGVFTLDDEPDAVDGARRVLAFAKDALHCARSVRYPHNKQPTVVRIGMHTGSCVSGLIGNKQMKFSLFGDTMNTASRMESTATPGLIQISEATYDKLPRDNDDPFIPTGGIALKGKGVMATFLWQPSEEAGSSFGSRGKTMHPKHTNNICNMLTKRKAAVAMMDGVQKQENRNAVSSKTGTTRSISMTAGCNLKNLGDYQAGARYPGSMKTIEEWGSDKPVWRAKDQEEAHPLMKSSGSQRNVRKLSITIKTEVHEEEVNEEEIHEGRHGR